MLRCERCDFEFQPEPYNQSLDLFCPNCGFDVKTQKAVVALSPLHWVRFYFQILWRILSNPTLFFKDLKKQPSLAMALSFALVTHWLSAAAAFLWHSLAGQLLTSQFGSMADSLLQFVLSVTDSDPSDRIARLSRLTSLKSQFTDWFWGVGSILLDPFWTLFSILFTALFVFLGSKVFAAGKERAHFDSAIQVVSYGMAPSILTIIPFGGTYIATLASLIVTILGAKVVYSVGGFRASCIVLFPKLLFLLTVVLGLFLILAFGAFLIFSIT